ncbi:glycosyltransferase [[Eubacterium] cellulosolvens]
MSSESHKFQKNNQIQVSSEEAVKPVLMIFPMNMLGHYLRCLEFCKRLGDKFHVLVAGSDRYNDLIKSAGFKNFQVEHFDPVTILNSILKFDFSWINIDDIKRVLSSQIKSIEEYKPYAVVGDVSLPLKMAAEKTCTKLISIQNGYMTKYYKFTRSVPSIHPGSQYSKKIPSWMFNRLVHVIEHSWLKSIHEPFRIIRKEMGLSKNQYYLDEFEGDLNLICDLPEFFPQSKQPSNYHYIGPLFHRGDEKENSIRDFLGDHEKNILVSMGSTGDWKNIDLLDDPSFKEYGIIVSGYRNPISSKSNIITKPFVNHSAIMDKIDVVICNGGNGTVYQALSYGIPVLCVTNIFEQEWNAKRVEEMKLGTFMNDLSDPDEVRSLVDFWIDRKGKSPFIEIKERIKTFIDRKIDLRLNEN